jgi:hypothetical protein
MVGTVLRTGSAIAKQVEAQQARDLMRDAAARADIPEQVRRRILENGSRILNCDPVQQLQQSEVFFDLRIHHVSAAVLAELSEDEIVRGLRKLADDAADRVCSRPQEAYLESRFIR